jgi:hypothetical protein
MGNKKPVYIEVGDTDDHAAPTIPHYVLREMERQTRHASQFREIVRQTREASQLQEIVRLARNASYFQEIERLAREASRFQEIEGLRRNASRFQEIEGLRRNASQFQETVRLARDASRLLDIDRQVRAMAQLTPPSVPASIHIPLSPYLEIVRAIRDFFTFSNAETTEPRQSTQTRWKIPDSPKAEESKPLSTPEERKAAVRQYKRECRKAGTIITNPSIWTAAEYADGSQFYRWQRGEISCPMIESVLKKKPHLNKTPQKPPKSH